MCLAIIIWEFMLPRQRRCPCWSCVVTPFELVPTHLQVYKALQRRRSTWVIIIYYHTGFTPVDLNTRKFLPAHTVPWLHALITYQFTKRKWTVNLNLQPLFPRIKNPISLLSRKLSSFHMRLENGREEKYYLKQI